VEESQLDELSEESSYREAASNSEYFDDSETRVEYVHTFRKKHEPEPIVDLGSTQVIVLTQTSEDEDRAPL
jgi:hypothetical protein